MFAEHFYKDFYGFNWSFGEQFCIGMSLYYCYTLLIEQQSQISM